MDEDKVEEFSVGAMLPVVQINSEQRENSLSDTSVEDLIDSTNGEIDGNEDSVISKVVNNMFDSLDLSPVKEEVTESTEEIILVEDLCFFEESVDWTMESTKDIDEDIKDVIKTLNDKGYVTKYSCSGHPSGRFKKDKFRDGILHKKLYSTARIVFANDYDLPSIPKYWELKVLDENKTAIYVKAPYFKIEDGLPIDNFYKWKKNYMNSLREWVKDLPKQGEKKEEKEVPTVESVIDDLIIDAL